MSKKINTIMVMVCLIVFLIPSNAISAYTAKTIDEIHGSFYVTKKIFYEFEMTEKTDFVFDGYVIIEGKKYGNESIEYIPRRVPDYRAKDINVSNNVEFAVYDENGIQIAAIYESIYNFDIKILQQPSIFLDADKEIIIDNFNYYTKQKDNDGDYLTWYDAPFYNKIVNRKGEVLNGSLRIKFNGEKYPTSCPYGLSKLKYEFSGSVKYTDVSGTVNVFRLPEKKYVTATSTTIYYSDTNNDNNKVLQYKLDNGKWTSKSKFTGLKPNTKHTLSIRVKKTSNHAASKIIKVTITTKKK